MSVLKQNIGLPNPGTMRLEAGGFKGLYETLSPAERALSYLSSAKNLLRDGKAAAITRTGRTKLGIAPATGACLGIAKYYPTTGVNKLITGIGSTLYAYHTGFADLTTSLTGANNDLYYVSNDASKDISVTYVNPGTLSASLSVVVTGSDIVVNLATDGAGAISSTASDVDTAIGNNVEANALVTVANAGSDTGAGLVTAMSKSYLTLWTPIKTGLTSGLPFQACQFNDYMILTNGTDDVMKFDGTTVSALGGTPPDSPFCLSAYSRIFLVSLPHLLYCSDVAAYEEWTDPDSAALPVNDKDGDQITWLQLYRSQVLIFKRHGIFELHGPELGKITDDWEIMRAGAIGTPAGRTVQEVEGILFWLSDNGVAAYSGGDVQIISAPVQDTIDLINWAAISTACAGKDGSGRYYLSLPINSDTYPTVTLVYNVRDDSWWKWEGWNPRCWDTYRFSSREQLIIAEQDGKVYQITGTTDDGTAIATEAIIGPSALGVVNNNKVIGRAHFVMSVADGATLTAAIAASDTASYGAAVSIAPIKATLTTALTGANNDLVWTAVAAGHAGNLISITYVDPGLPNQSLSVSVSGNDITVNLATNASSVITSTAALVEAAVEGATSLVTGANSGADTGAGVVTAMAKSYLDGGWGGASGAIYRANKRLPLTSGEESDVFAPAIKIVGAGVITLHDFALEFEGREGQ